MFPIKGVATLRYTDFRFVSVAAGPKARWNSRFGGEALFAPVMERRLWRGLRSFPRRAF